ncbi:MAG: hypothetical protein Ct9H90mP8_0770 [Pseudomonadota bacterium]|nr:MAG: hypothetical protein Ct9H90mP8_0770 [Pseudomonadota bacterium]
MKHTFSNMGRFRDFFECFRSALHQGLEGTCLFAKTEAVFSPTWGIPRAWINCPNLQSLECSWHYTFRRFGPHSFKFFQIGHIRRYRSAGWRNFFFKEAVQSVPVPRCLCSSLFGYKKKQSLVIGRGSPYSNSASQLLLVIGGL